MELERQQVNITRRRQWQFNLAHQVVVGAAVIWVLSSAIGAIVHSKRWTVALIDVWAFTILQTLGEQSREF